MSLRRDSYGLKDSGGADHTGSIGESKVVSAWLDWLATGCRDSGHQLSDVRCLSRGYSLESCDLIGAETETGEVGVGELCEALLIKG